jgi:hypothetical protein
MAARQLTIRRQMRPRPHLRSRSPPRCSESNTLFSNYIISRIFNVEFN